MTRGWDVPLAASAIALAALGITAVYVSDHSGIMPGGFVLRQIVWVILGLIVSTAIARASPGILTRYSPYLFGCALLLLGVCLLFPSIRGAKSWIPLGPVRLQPSELMKPCLILTLGLLLSSPAVPRHPYRFLAFSALIASLPVGLILLQPDAGTAVTYMAILVGMPFAAGLPVSLLLFPILGGAMFGGRILLAIADEELLLFPSNLATLPLHDPKVGAIILVAALPLTLFIRNSRSLRRRGVAAAGILVMLACYLASFPIEAKLKEYQRQRIVAFVKPEADPRGSAYNVIQSQIAVGAGGVFGRGISGATQTKLGFLPERHTDFVFSALAETFGFAGAGGALILFGVLLHRILLVGQRATTRGSGLVCAGVASLFALQIGINIGMTVGLVPVMGIPLPLLSYGGSSIVSAFICLGLVQGIARTRNDSIV